MRRQILLCVETNSRARTDYQYIHATIKHFYVDDRKISYKPVFLDSKTKYNAKDKVRDIEKKIKDYDGETSVIYFIDVDDYDTSYETKELFERIKAYCMQNGYDFVFFKEDIEDVYWGEHVSDDEKMKRVEAFNRNWMIKNVDEMKLSSNRMNRHYSNILNVLDKYFVRK